jgi:membrane-associated phospholipid phosphatase
MKIIDRMRAAVLGARQTTAATFRRFFARKPGGALARLFPHWMPVLTLGLLLPLSAMALLDPVYVAGRRALSAEVIAFGLNFHTFGKSGWYLWPLGIFLVAVAFVDWRRLGRRALARMAALTQIAWFAFLALGSGEVISSILKQAIGRARPPLAAEYGVFAFDSWTADYLWASFPSGHATTFGVLACVLAFLFPRAKWLLLCAALWLGATRAIIGVHYPSDVLAGLILGGWVAYAWAVLLARRRILFKADKDGRLTLRWSFGVQPAMRAIGLQTRRRPRAAQMESPARAVLA